MNLCKLLDLEGCQQIGAKRKNRSNQSYVMVDLYP